jgi:hypothetical protein
MPSGTSGQQGTGSDNTNSQSPAAISSATQATPTAPTPQAPEATPIEHHQPTTHTLQAELPRQITNLAGNIMVGPAVLAINDLKDETTLNANSQLLVMSAQQQSATVRSESINVAVTKSQAIASQSAKSPELRGSVADRDADSIVGTDELTLHQSPIEIAANFAHSEYVEVNKPSVSVELAVGYALAMFSAAQLTTKSLATVGSNIIHSPVFHADHLGRHDELEDG